MKRFTCLAVLPFVMIYGAASAEEWPKLVSTDDGSTLYVKPQSGRIEMNKGDEAMFAVDAKHIYGGSIFLMQITIKLADCIHEKGVMLTRDLGSDTDQELPFILGSGTAASVAAEILCKAGLTYLQDPDAT